MRSCFIFNLSQILLYIFSFLFQVKKFFKNGIAKSFSDKQIVHLRMKDAGLLGHYLSYLLLDLGPSLFVLSSLWSQSSRNDESLIWEVQSLTTSVLDNEHEVLTNENLMLVIPILCWCWLWHLPCAVYSNSIPSVVPILAETLGPNYKRVVDMNFVFSIDCFHIKIYEIKSFYINNSKFLSWMPSI